LSTSAATSDLSATTSTDRAATLTADRAENRITLIADSQFHMSCLEGYFSPSHTYLQANHVDECDSSLGAGSVMRHEMKIEVGVSYRSILETTYIVMLRLSKGYS
jgi:hypothetical protein